MKKIKFKKLYRVTLSKIVDDKIEDIETIDVVAVNVDSAIRKTKYNLTQENVDKSVFVDGAVRVGIVSAKS